MGFLKKAARDLRNDSVARRVLATSGVLFSTHSIGLGLSLVQTVLAARLLDPSGFGLVAIVMAYASTVNGLLSFRMSELVVRYAGEYLDRGERTRAAAVVKAAALGEAGASLLAFLGVALSSGLAARYIAKAPESAWMFTVFALGLLANFGTETATGVLQALGRIRLQGLIHLGQSALSAGLMVWAFLGGGNVAHVLYVYLVGKLVTGLATFLSAAFLFERDVGRTWWRVPLASVPEVRSLFRFALSSNLSATAILIFRESEVLWVGYFLTSEAAGYYKAAYAIVSLLSVPANPLILATYPELNRLVVQEAWTRLREFLRRITSVSLAYNLVLAAGFGLLGTLLLRMYGPAYVTAYPALLILVIGLAFNYSLFWNRPLLLSLGMPEFPLKVVLAVGLVKTVLAFALVPGIGITAAAGLLSFYYVVSVGVMVYRGTLEIRRRERALAI